MVFRLLVGRAGTGCTRRCLEEIFAHQKHAPLGPPLLLITPDQVTFTMEQEIAARGGSMRAQVFSFRRLAYRVLQEAGGATRVSVSELGRRMMLKGIILDEGERLPLLRALHNRPGCLASLSGLIGELKVNQIGPDDLEALSAAADGRLVPKLREISLVYRLFEERLGDRMTDPDGYLDLLARHLPRAAGLRGCRVWVDGFVTFTPQEFAVLRALCAVAAGITVTLCLDPGQLAAAPPDHSPFRKPWETRRRLANLAREAGAAYDEVLLEPDTGWRLAAAPELAHLEQYYFTYPTQPYGGEVRRVHLLAAQDPRAEAAGVARAIRRLLREGLRPRQVMVAVRDVDTYFPLFRCALADYEIPFFLDHRRPVAHHPLVELLRAALEVGRSNWAHEPVFRYLKTGLTGVDRDRVDRLENYALAAGIRGRRWYDEEPWRYRPGTPSSGAEGSGGAGDDFDPAESDAIRREAVAELAWFHREARALAGAPQPRLKGRDWARLLVEFCLRLGVPRRLDAWSEASLAAGAPELAREHRQVWRLVINVLDELVEVLGEAELAEEELAAILDAAWEGLRLSLIPPRLDAVTVGSLERSRPPRDVRAMFLAGLNEGVLPAFPRIYGFLTEAEREQLAGLLGGRDRRLKTADDRLQEEQFLVYRALTRTGGELWLSYPLGDAEGRALAPAAAVRRVRELLPGLAPRFLPAEPPGGAADNAWMEHPAGLLPHLARCCREALAGRRINPAWWRVYNLLLSDPVWGERLRPALAGLWGGNQERPVAPAIALELWGRPGGGRRRVLKTSVSGLERYTGCPFAFFLEMGLGLGERVAYGLTPPDTGRLYHEALRAFVTQVREAGLDWQQLDDPQVDRLCAEIVEELAGRLQDRILLSSARLRRQKEFLLERVRHSARALTRQLQRSRFRPLAVEVAFGGAARGARQGGPRAATPPEGGCPFLAEFALPALELPLETVEGQEVVLRLTGRIDRIDVAADGGVVYFRVVDYKTGPSDLDLAGVLAGLQLQLPVYWLVVEAGLPAIVPGAAEVRPGGALYFPVGRPLVKLNPEVVDLEEEWLREFQLQGWLVNHGPDFFRLLDASLENGGASVIVPLRLTGEGKLYAALEGRVLSPAEWRALAEELARLLRAIGRDILSGRVDIAPVQAGGASACGCCPYRPVCRFDPLLPENRPRALAGDRRALRERLAAKAAGKEVGPLALYRLDR
ncbi:MAG: PD-(D/E)XK nuclease family protein [Bacillota bacterium]